MYNNPLIPGDPYMYDIKWIVSTLIEAIDLYRPLSQDFEDLKTYVENYFANLDLTEEVQSIIDEMEANGTFTAMIREIVENDSSIEGIITNWLNTNVTPVGSAVVLNRPLSLIGAAADAGYTGAKIDGNAYFTSWTIGLVDSAVGSAGTINPAFTNHISTDDIQKFDFDICIDIPSGFRAKLIYFDENDLVSGFDNNYDRYHMIVDAGRKFKIDAIKIPTVVITDENEYIKAVTYRTINKRIITNAKLDNDILFGINRKLEIPFDYGTVSGSGGWSGSMAIVRSVKPIFIEKETQFYCESSNFELALFKYSPSLAYLGYSGYYPSVTAPGGYYYVICVRERPFDSSVIADVDTYKNNVCVIPAKNTSDIRFKTRPDNSPIYGAKSRIIAHQGKHDIYPANSEPAFIEACSDGAWGFETDIRLTSDGVMVCSHNDDISTTTTGTGLISAMTYAQLNSYYLLDGLGNPTTYKIPKFEDAIKICKKYNCMILADPKDMTAAQIMTLIDTIKAYNVPHIVATDLTTQRAVQASYPETAFVLAAFNSFDDIIDRAAENINTDAIAETGNGYTPTEAQFIKAHNAGRLLGVGGVNTATDIERYFSLGADFILSDVIVTI